METGENLIKDVIQKNLGQDHTRDKELILAGQEGIIYAKMLYDKKPRNFSFSVYARHSIKEFVIAKYVGIDRKKAEKYAKLMGYLKAAKGHVEALIS